MGKTHMLGGAAAGLAVVTFSGTMNPIVAGTGVACAVAGSLLPDIDHPQAKIARMNLLFSFISHAICTVTNHRHFCHTIPFVALIAVGWVAMFGLAGNLLGPHIDHFLREIGNQFTRNLAAIDVTHYILFADIFLIVGMLSHLLLDTLNPEGIMWLYPVKRDRISLCSISTNSLGEIIVSAALVALILVWCMLLAGKYGIFG